MEASTPQEHRGNPAGRLYLLMSHLRTSGQTNSSVGVQLAHYLGLPAGPINNVSPELVRAISEFLALPDQVEEAVSLRPVKRPSDDFLLRPLERIRPALSYLAGNVNMALEQFRGYYTDVDVSNLEHCSYYLEEDERPVDQNRLVAIRDLARDIMSLVVQSDEEDLDAEIRTLIWDHAKKIADAADLAQAMGSGILVSAHDETVGHLYRRQDLLSTLPKSSTGKKFMDLLSTLGLVVSLATNAAALPQDIHGALELLPTPSVSIIAPGPDFGGSPDGGDPA